MNWIDLLRMSSGNLKRRKLRTFLTVLGVVIGTTSIVVMISLGLGMQQSMYKEIEQSGGLNTITVTGVDAGESMISYGGFGSEDSQEPTKRLTDDVIEQFSKMDHVTLATPVYNMSILLLKGQYEGWGQLIAMTPEGLAAQNITLAGDGKLPKTNSSKLELVYGNGVITQFMDKSGTNQYWETGELPAIDLAKDSVFLILDQEGYYQSQNQGIGAGTVPGDSEGQEGASKKPVQKYAVRASGIVEGDPETYNTHYYNIYCDLDTLKQVLKKEFSGRVIPGQPATKSGKPYKEFSYSSAQVKVDDINEVDNVSTAIRQLGYNTSTNAEYMESMKGQMAIIQAVLGGIGAVSLLVAAIGIANTMMMSIYERTKEIGVIKVLGCSLKNIKQMFLMEAAFIGLIGGVVGSILSYLLSALINFLTGNGAAMGIDGNISYIPVWLVLAAMAFAVFVGMSAGYFPALRAMRLSPLAAIRNE